MRNIPGKTLILIGALITLTVVLLGIAIFMGGQKKSTQTNAVATITPTPTIEKTANITFSPSNLDFSLSTTPSATVDLITTTGKNPITGAQVDVSYDPAIIQNVQLLPPDPATSLFGPVGSYTTLFTDTKVPGKASFAVAINPSGNPVSGTGSVGRISFTVVKTASPTAMIKFEKGTIVTSNTTQESVLNTTTPLTIKLN